MRRSASEVIRELEIRVARLERQTHQKVALWDPSDFTTAYNDELESIFTLVRVLSSSRNSKEMSLKVFLKCLSLNRANTIALKLSKKLNIKGWESDREVLNYALMLKTKHGTKGVGRIFTMIADRFSAKKLELALKGSRLLAPLYDADDFMGLWNLILGSNGVSLNVLYNKLDIKVEYEQKLIEEGEVGVANHGGADIYSDEIENLYEDSGSFTIPLGVNLNLFYKPLVENLEEYFRDYLTDEYATPPPAIKELYERFSWGHGGDTTIHQIDFRDNEIVGSYTNEYYITEDAREYYSPY